MIDERDAQTTVDLSRRELMQALGAGLLVAVTADSVLAQAQPRENRPRQRGREPVKLSARLHIAPDGIITVMSGKVEAGQGARAEITQATAEELRISPAKVRVILGDTELCPDDGPTFGSRTTPDAIPSIRRGAAAARELLIDLAAKQMEAPRTELVARDGQITHPQKSRAISYEQLVGEALSKAFSETTPGNDVQITPVKEWTVLGTPAQRPNGREIVTGLHVYPSDITRPNMLYGKVLRPPAIGASLESIDLAPAQAMQGVVVVRDGTFVGVAAATTHAARRAIDALATTAKWSLKQQVSSPGLFEHLRNTARNPGAMKNPKAEELKDNAKAIRNEYRTAFVQHAPMEPRAAVAEWVDGKLTVWTASQVPTRVRTDVMQALGISPESVRVIVPDFGGAFGGKHSGECAVEAARLAKAAGRPVSLRWTREEEFMWASFRPAAMIIAETSLADDASLASWHFINVNSGAAGIRSPYRCAAKQEQHLEADSPLRHGSYRALAATANNFARECLIDELAQLAGMDPLAFRLKQLDDPRLIAVLKSAAEKFGWDQRVAKKDPARGVGIACGMEKGSFVANCVEVSIDLERRDIVVNHVCLAYDCGKILNPDNLVAQVQGAIVQGIGPALWEEIHLDNGVVTNNRFSRYRVPRLTDMPEMSIHLLDQPDKPSVGAGETPLIAVAPAISSAVFHATRQRLRSLPMRMSEKA